METPDEYLPDSFNWVPLPAQWFNPQRHVTSVDEFTGSLFCPQRLSGMAVARCGEYQQRFGCGAACPNAATAAEIAAVKTAAGHTCDSCGSWKLYSDRAICSLCERRKNRDERHEAKRRRRELKVLKPRPKKRRLCLA